jgi:ankyrin repeat protein
MHPDAFYACHSRDICIHGRRREVTRAWSAGEAVWIADNDWTSASEREAGLGSALHSAAVRGQKEAVHLLLERGADSALQDTKGKTAMQKASENGHSEIVELLRRQGVTVI